MTPFEHQRKINDQILKSYSNADQLIKAGEGSRGGKVIGHTKSGKAVYANQHPKDYKDFNGNDHRDAFELHSKRYEDATKVVERLKKKIVSGTETLEERKEWDNANKEYSEGGFNAKDHHRRIK